ncbi:MULTISPECIES: short-chain dehydrogenase [unclassified Streptomyces]|uniref:short-chain dehydrogenase n=1 Tax=unclassified Streptomyces TaxID=2593676 RepID=UPI00214BF7C6|nr:MULTISPECIES: short-chain dehydrogenase [unclassified Streptomyces]
MATARLALDQGARVVLTGRDPERLRAAAEEADALSTAAFDAHDPVQLERFFHRLPGPIDHVMFTAGGPSYGRLLDMDAEQTGTPGDQRPHGARTPRATTPPPYDQARRHPSPPGRHGGPTHPARSRCRPRGHRRDARVHGRSRARDAPVRVNLIAAGFVDTPLSARPLGDALDARREELGATLPIGRVVVLEDAEALAVHIMTNTCAHGRDVRHRRRPATRRLSRTSGAVTCTSNVRAVLGMSRSAAVKGPGSFPTADRRSFRAGGAPLGRRRGGARRAPW